MKFAVIGGDLRHAKLSELLAENGHIVSSFAIEKLKLGKGVLQTASVSDAVENAACVILPLPVTSKEGVLNTPLSAKLHMVREILSSLTPNQIVCAGRIDAETYSLAKEMGIELIDYFAREELAIKNAVATAEGAIQLIMEETPITISGSKCLVIGFGRIGKVLCHRLRNLGADVTASARSYSDMAWIEAYNYGYAETAKLEGTLREYDIIVNTVPSRVLGESRLREVKEGCLCLDLASKPGGMDFTAASKLGVKAVWALSLPGEVAPVSAGKIVADTVFNILAEKGVKT